MTRVVSRAATRGYREIARLVASSRDRGAAAAACSKASTWSTPTSTASACPTRVVASEDALSRPGVAALVAARAAGAHDGRAGVAVRRAWARCCRTSACSPSRAHRTRIPAFPATACCSSRRAGSGQPRARCCVPRRRPACRRRGCRRTARSRGRRRCCVPGRARTSSSRCTRTSIWAPVADALRSDGVRVLATVASGGTPIDRATLARRVALAVGNEGAGLSAGLQREGPRDGDDPDAGRHRVAQRGRGDRGRALRGRAATRYCCGTPLNVPVSVQPLPEVARPTRARCRRSTCGACRRSRPRSRRPAGVGAAGHRAHAAGLHRHAFHDAVGCAL